MCRVHPPNQTSRLIYHQHNSRNATSFVIPSYHPSQYKKEPSNKGIFYYNLLPDQLRKELKDIRNRTEQMMAAVQTILQRQKMIPELSTYVILRFVPILTIELFSKNI